MFDRDSWHGKRYIKGMNANKIGEDKMSVEVTKIVKHYGDDNELHRKGGSALQEYVNDILSKEEWYTHGRLCKRKIYNGEGKLRHMSIHFKERRNDTGLDAQGYMVYTYYKSKSFK